MASRNTPNPSGDAVPDADTFVVTRVRRPRGLVNEIVASLGEDIRAGRTKPGDKLPTEAEIMLRFDVSRTVVREAVSRLQACGLVETRHGIGTFVRPPDTSGNFKISAQDFATVADVIAVLELRISLEAEAAAHPAASGRHASRLAHLQDVHRAGFRRYSARLPIPYGDCPRHRQPAFRRFDDLPRVLGHPSNPGQYAANRA